MSYESLNNLWLWTRDRAELTFFCLQRIVQIFLADHLCQFFFSSIMNTVAVLCNSKGHYTILTLSIMAKHFYLQNFFFSKVSVIGMNSSIMVSLGSWRDVNRWSETSLFSCIDLILMTFIYFQQKHTAKSL